MKLNFNDKSNDKKIDITKINLSTHNPRYTTISSIDEKLIDKIKDLGTKTQNEVKNELLSNEGDFSDLKNLLKSIYNIGFNSEREPIILAESNNSYVVAEGNRRLMCLKFISGELKIPEKIEEISNIDNLDDLFSDNDEKNKNYFVRRQENYNDIIKIIDSIKGKDKDIDVVFEIIDNNEELWRAIYTKHVAGDRPGMRHWTRGKYFTDILSFFVDGILIESDISNSVRRLLQREPNTIIDDFKHAQFVKSILKEAKIYDVKYDEITNGMIFEKMKKIKVSALQSNFGLKRVKDSAKEFLNIDNKVFEDKYFSYNYDDKNLINFPRGKKVKEILSLIYVYFKKGAITTRPIKNEYKQEFNLAVKKTINSTNIKTKDAQTTETLKKIDSFDYSIKELSEIIDNAKRKNIDQAIIKRFDATKRIKENNNRIELFNDLNFSENNPSSVFTKLKEQYAHNEKEKTFLNAMAATLRSMLEQIFIWGGYFVEDILNTTSNSTTLESQKKEYIDNMSKNKINNLFFKIRNNHLNIIDIKKIVNSITKLKKDSASEFIFNNKGEINSLLNEFIHASHRIYDSSSFVDNLTKFAEWQKNILEILEDIDLDKIKLLNDKLSFYIN